MYHRCLVFGDNINRLAGWGWLRREVPNSRLQAALSMDTSGLLARLTEFMASWLRIGRFDMSVSIHHMRFAAWLAGQLVGRPKSHRSCRLWLPLTHPIDE